MTFKMKGPSLLKMVAELKKSPTKKDGSKEPVEAKNLPEDVTKMPKKKIKPLPVSTDVKLKK